jgi:hypothetical protein
MRCQQAIEPLTGTCSLICLVNVVFIFYTHNVISFTPFVNARLIQSTFAIIFAIV